MYICIYILAGNHQHGPLFAGKTIGMPLTSWQAIKLMLATQEWKADYFKVRETCSMHVTLVDTEVWFKNSLRIFFGKMVEVQPDVKGKSKLQALRTWILPGGTSL